MRDLLKYFIAGVAGAFGFAPFYLWPFYMLSICVLFISIWQENDRKKALLCGFSWGFGINFAGLCWIGNALLIEPEKFMWLLPIACIAFPLFISIYNLLFALLIARVKKPRKYFFAFVVAFSVTEYLRGILFTGFPWNLSAHIFASNPPIASIASLIGSYGAGIVYIFLFCIPGYFYISRYKRCSLIVGALLTSLLYGIDYFVTMPSVRFRDGITIRLVQPNIEQKYKNNAAYAKDHFEKLLNMSLRKPRPTCAIWPEAAIPWAIPAINNVPPNRKVPIVAGAVCVSDSGIYNGIVSWNKAGVRNIYNKLHLLPFGEYFPFRKILQKVFPEWMIRKVTPGDKDFSSVDLWNGEIIDPVSFANLPPFRAMICYESIFPLSLYSCYGAKWILVITNDAWFGNSPGPHQHLASSVFRAIESGLPLVRVANSGISCLIDPYGRIVQSIGLEKEGALDVSLPFERLGTPYMKYGDYSFFGIVAILFMFAILL